MGDVRSYRKLQQEIEGCQRCPRLIEHCRAIGSSKRRAYQEQTYWARPVPNFGTFPAAVLLVGLAPGAHGANRTGRMFTGDESGRWLYRALHRAGLANQPTWQSATDGLQLLNCAITAVNHCAPPGNKPTVWEMEQCSDFLQRSISLCNPKVIVVLGRIAWDRTWRALGDLDWIAARPARAAKPKFQHGAVVDVNPELTLVGSYHPSQQNTFTGRLTEPMLDQVFQLARDRL